FKNRIRIHLNTPDIGLQGYSRGDLGTGREYPGKVLPPRFRGAEVLVNPGELNVLTDRPGSGLQYPHHVHYLRVERLLFYEFQAPGNYHNLVEDIVARNAGEEIELPVCGPQRLLGPLAPGNIAAYDLDRRLSLVHGSGCDYFHVNGCPVNTMEPLFDQGDCCSGVFHHYPDPPAHNTEECRFNELESCP